MLETEPAAVVNTDPKAPANGAATPAAGTTQAPATSQPAPAASTDPGKPAPAATDEFRVKYEKLIAESIPKIQSDLGKANSENTTLRAKVAELESAAIDPDEIAVERDQSWISWLEKSKGEGHTLESIVKYLKTEATKFGETRQQAQTERQTVESVINMVRGYDEPFATFLENIDKKAAGKVTLETLPNLRELFDSLGGKTPPATTTAAESTTAAAAPPPAVGAAAPAAQGGPVWKPGMTSRDIFAGIFKRGT